MPPPAHPHSALIVDDDPAMREALVFYLQSIGHQARPAAGGRDALQQLRSGFRPCAIVLDVRMPDMDGWELLDTLRRDRVLVEVPVVMYAGGAEHAARAVRLGVLSYLTKPADPEAIAAAIAAHCPRTRA